MVVVTGRVIIVMGTGGVGGSGGGGIGGGGWRGGGVAGKLLGRTTWHYKYRTGTESSVPVASVLGLEYRHPTMSPLWVHIV